MFDDGDFGLNGELGPELDGVVEKGGADCCLLVLFGCKVGDSIWVVGIAEFWWAWAVLAGGGEDGVATSN